MTPLHIQGMHGLGDCIHQRAIVRQLMKHRAVTLETSWPSIYHDLIAEGLAVTRRPVGLRTQAKNAARESDKYVSRHFTTRPSMRVRYTGQQVLASPSKTILEVMCHETQTNFAEADFSLPVPDPWFASLAAIPAIAAIEDRRPWCVFRPLVARAEWRGSMARNADPAAYAELFARIRENFFTISVADLCEGQEWIVGNDVPVDLKLHNGELVFEQLAALFKRADLVFTSSGFAAVLGPAVGTPTISIVGGYEDPRCHDAGKRHAPYLAIGPKSPCTCWTSQCRRACPKEIDMPEAHASIGKFLSQTCIQVRDNACRE